MGEARSTARRDGRFVARRGLRVLSIDEQLSDGAGSGVDRRAALKKAAIAAGVVAWSTPVVQAVTARPVHAATITGCAPVFTVESFLFGPRCECVVPSPGPDSPCCGENYVILPLVPNCGPTCPGTPVVNNLAVEGSGPAGCLVSGDAVVRALPCTDGTSQVTITADIACPGGINYNGASATLVIPCTCGESGPVPAAVQDFLEELAATSAAPPEMTLSAETTLPETTVPAETVPPETTVPGTTP